MTFNSKGQIASEAVWTLSQPATGPFETRTSYITNDHGSGYDYGFGYGRGALVAVRTADYKDGTYQYSTTTSNVLAWRDGAVVSSPSFAKTGQSTYHSFYTDA